MVINTRVLILGASGMLGNTVFRLLSKSPGFSVFGTMRSNSSLNFLSAELHKNIITSIDVEKFDCLTRILSEVRPDIVINCIGLIKQLKEANDPLEVIPINSIFPHRLAKVCALIGSRLIHMSTDCVFSGNKGLYSESDFPDALDLYGRSKYLGEVDYANAITLRTSIIGHELNSNRSLIGWFLAQNGSVKGFERAIFSGLPAVEIGRVIRDYVIPHPDLRGLYHVSAEPISKYDLLLLVSKVYEKKIEVIPDKRYVIDLSLNSSRFQKATGFRALEWEELVSNMLNFR